MMGERNVSSRKHWASLAVGPCSGTSSPSHCRLVTAVWGQAAGLEAHFEWPCSRSSLTPVRFG